MFYLVTYVLTTVGTFGLDHVPFAPGFRERRNMRTWPVLARRSPWTAGVMTVFMFSLAGLPPMVGFFAKLAIIQALVSTNVPLYIGLAVAAVMFSLVGAFYYLRVIKIMWFDEPVRTLTRCSAAPVSPRCWPPTVWRCCCSDRSRAA